MAKIMVIDDDRMICEALSALFEPMGHDVSYALNLNDGLKEIVSGSFDLIFLDVRLPDGNGLEAIPKIKDSPSSPEIIIITGEGDPDGAELAIKSGSWDYIQKPLAPNKITLPLTRVLEYRERSISSNPPIVLDRGNIIGESRQIKRSLDLVAKASQTDANVLLIGDSGTGKELFAHAVHANSRRAENAFVVVDCAALPETLVESILFGHEKGSFTGADKPRSGLIKEAHEGTLFLDEVAELPMDIQSSFLRVLQEHRFRPVGGRKEVKSDFRLIAATNRNLEEMVKEGKFRQDLFFRLQSVVIDLPPLRERTQDIREITLHYMTRFCDQYNIGIKGLSPDFLDALQSYSWPGNVRELINALERTLSFSSHETVLFPIHLPTHIRAKLARTSVESGSQNISLPNSAIISSEPIPKFRELIDSTEKGYFQNLLTCTKGDIKEACRLSDLSRSQIYRLLKKHNIARDI